MTSRQMSRSVVMRLTSSPSLVQLNASAKTPPMSQTMSFEGSFPGPVEKIETGASVICCIRSREISKLTDGDNV